MEIEKGKGIWMAKPEDIEQNDIEDLRLLY